MKKNIDNPIVQRILKAFGFTKLAELYRLIGKTSQNINGMINRGTLVKNYEVELIKRNINLDWIKTGRGDMHDSQASGVSEFNPIYLQKINIADLKAKTETVLRSNTAYSTALKDIIVAYYEATICQEELAEKQKVLDNLSVVKES